MGGGEGLLGTGVQHDHVGTLRQLPDLLRGKRRAAGPLRALAEDRRPLDVDPFHPPEVGRGGGHVVHQGLDPLVLRQPLERVVEPALVAEGGGIA